ncbi:MAG: PorV/PorQ family protein, partial [Calditrichaeota bacterium]|nr:PorV/PorQ family protein [Calditrichota bacterium]MCB0303438.1 PorV/PorQ family protein [Calditrichota bacterium]MCB9088194.1 PorV/PorQ family protein [Calditrichia bacterium]
MKRLIGILILLLLPQLLWAQIFPTLGGQRVGTAAAQFLKIGVGARAIGMGESYVAVANDAEALYWNPAGIVLFERPVVFFAHNQWLVDTRLEFAGAVYHLGQGNSIGAAITYLHTEDMVETTELQPFGTGRMFGFSDFLFSFTYARKMTDQFSFGLSTKFMQETIADLKMRGLLFDLGIYYKTGWKSTRFAVAVSNFGRDLTPDGTVRYRTLSNDEVAVTSFQSFAPPILFRIGLAGELLDQQDHRLTASMQLNHPNDNSENLNWGVEYWWKGMFALRGGYKTAQAEESYSLGFGLNFPITMADFKLDYAFTDFGRLGTVNRFGIQLMF